MTARGTPYPPPGFQIRIPARVWVAALAEVRRYAALNVPGGRPGSEGLVYFGGIPAADSLIVTSLFRLQHVPQGDRVRPTPDQVRWLLAELRQRDEKLIAQLHSHRHDASHSPGDDEMATSFHEGFLSIVVPNFGRNVSRIEQCIAHEYRDGTFRPLGTAEAGRRFVIYSQILGRDTPAGQNSKPEEPSSWRAFARKLKRTGHAKLSRPKA